MWCLYCLPVKLFLKDLLLVPRRIGDPVCDHARIILWSRLDTSLALRVRTWIILWPHGTRKAPRIQNCNTRMILVHSNPKITTLLRFLLICVRTPGGTNFSTSGTNLWTSRRICEFPEGTPSLEKASLSERSFRKHILNFRKNL